MLSQALEGGSFQELVDPKMEDYNFSEVAQMIACAAVCVRSSARRRPQMSQVNVLRIQNKFSYEKIFIVSVCRFNTLSQIWVGILEMFHE